MISLIAAIQRKDRGIGFKNELLFRITDDLKRFKALTSGHPVIMGRKTFDSIGKPLPNRTNIVVTRQNLFLEGVTFVGSHDEALQTASAIDSTIFILGGSEIYSQTLPFADKLELTIVDGDVEADTFFPEYGEFSKVIAKEERIDEKTGLAYEWITLTK